MVGALSDGRRLAIAASEGALQVEKRLVADCHACIVFVQRSNASSDLHESACRAVDLFRAAGEEVRMAVGALRCPRNTDKPAPAPLQAIDVLVILKLADLWQAGVLIPDEAFMC